MGEKMSNQVLNKEFLADKVDIRDDILYTIGKTPLVRLNRVARGVSPSVLAKVEFFNPGGSVKDRIGLPIIIEAEQAGRSSSRDDRRVHQRQYRCGPGDCSAIRGYRCIFVLPDKMSDEKSGCCVAHRW
jgi:cystathionine beta-synthase